MPWQVDFIREFGPGGFTGCTFADWWSILCRNQFAVDARYLPRAAVITVGSLFNSLMRRWEQFRFADAVARIEVSPPLFVLGVWRSGTTHLHNLLAQDDRFAYPNTYQVYYPHTFLTTESWNQQAVQRFLPKTRPMDNVKFGIQEPQEDEFALAAMGLSFLIESMAFPRTGRYYRRFLSMKDAEPAQIEDWAAHWKWFLQKLTFKYGKPLVLKSPAHTGRIRLLLELFPKAKFVHIHRHPFTVLQSSLHTVSKAMPFWTLQKFERHIDRFIEDHNEIYNAYFEQRALIPAENLAEIAFHDLEQQPLDQLRRVYQSLQLPDFSEVEPKLTAYLETLAGYEKNRFPELPREIRDRAAREWSRCFAEWGYQT